jgi:predicted dehydrogenase
MKKLRGVAAGAGYFSRYHFEAWQRIGHAEITALCSLDALKAREAAQQYGIAQVYDDVAVMLDREQPDFIDIITPPQTHLQLVRLAAERGVHILCQKPLAPAMEGARAIVDMAAKAAVRLMVHDNFRFQPWHREAKLLLDQGAIGQLQTISCRTRLGDGWGVDAYLARQPYFRDMPRFLIFETGVHFIDVYRYLAGDIARVYARLRRLNPVIQGEDCALVCFDFASGAAGLWDADRFHEGPAKDPRYTFGEFSLEGDAGALRINGEGNILLRRLGEAEKLYPYAPSHRGFAGDSVLAALNHFIDCLRDGRPFETNGQDYLKTLAVQEAVYASAAQDRPVAVDPGAGGALPGTVLG